eukprot:TRINITY_DN14384_c0_g1_i4.p1 TRINITY_DN14384_c0_g1~~TRINITY_DN14384_c0_g1_i4.p1  ORF type:complete len:689 (+),score=106.23 TRINITY_DN14384_c0_g1_i4:43-2067(+)
MDAAKAWCRNGASQTWTDPQTGRSIWFRALLISPQGLQQEKQKYPLAVYFPGLGEKPEVIQQMKSDWTSIAPEPFLMVAPARPDRMWWFINNDKQFGWVEGDFVPEVASSFSAWLAFLADCTFVDSARIGLFGFSAGAYAAVELLSHGCVPLSGIGLGGVHGHGQKDAEDLPPDKVWSASEKFSAFLRRLRRHKGVPWIEATHGKTDQESKWTDAQEILHAISEQQVRLGLPRVSIRALAPEDQDVKPSKKRNRSNHNYFHAAFYRRDFLVALLGGRAPPAFVSKAQDDDDDAWTQPEAADAQQQSPLQFQWDAGNSLKRKWKDYAPPDHERIVKSFKDMNGKGVAQVFIDGWSYKFDFDLMQQIDPSNGQTWRIRRWGEAPGHNTWGRSRSPQRIPPRGIPPRHEGGNAHFAAQRGASVPAQASQLRPRGTWPSRVTVAGCADAKLSSILNGSYSLQGENCSKPVYTRYNEQWKLTVTIYYRDARDGPVYQGWWFGPSVNSDNVWALAKNRDDTPPSSGWHIPPTGPIDPSMAVTPHEAGAAEFASRSSPVQARPARPLRPAGNWPSRVSVAGCSDAKLSSILNGMYSLHAENCSKPVYSRYNEQWKLTVMIYYWDGRDGPVYEGWWFGPCVGSDDVWALAKSLGDTPPSSGWRCPPTGPIDPTMVVTTHALT